MRVVLFHDEVSEKASPDEADVVTQMDAIAGALADLGHESVRVPCTLNLEAAAGRLRSAQPDIVFNLVESIGGQGRLISVAPQLLESLGIRHTGCSAAATFATSGKPLSKQLLSAANIPTPAWHSLDQLRAVVSIQPGRYILKSAWEHASRGIDDDSIVDVRNAAELAGALQRRLPELAGEGFAETYVEGREFNLSMLCGTVLPAAEIVFEGYSPGKPRIVGYSAKWDERSAEYVHTPRRFDFPPDDASLLGVLSDAAAACWRLFGLRGYARVDFRVDAGSKPWVLEVNSNPCLSPDAGFAAAVARAGLSYTEAIERIVNDATFY